MLIVKHSLHMRRHSRRWPKGQCMHP